MAEGWDKVQALFAESLISLMQSGQGAPTEITDVDSALKGLLATLLETYVSGEGRMQQVLHKLILATRNPEDPLMRELDFDARMAVMGFTKTLLSIRTARESTLANQNASPALHARAQP